MDFSPSAEAVAVRRQVREALDDALDDDVRERVARTGTHHDWGVHRALAQRGLLAAALPVQLGGQGRDAEQLAALFHELEIAGAPYDGVSNTMMVAYVLAQVGSAFHKDEVLPRLLDGSAVPCLGYSEPGSGSDVAAAATRARRDGGGWVVDGQKMFTSLAEQAAWCFLLARTDPEAPKHRGLSFFLVPMDAPGVEIRPMRTVSGKRTNVTFYDGVAVDDRYRVGEVDGGWDVMRVALAFERGVVGGVAYGRLLFDAALGYVRDARDASGTPLIDDPVVQERLVRVAIDNEVAELLAQRAAWVATSGQLPAQEGSECKLFASEAFNRAARWLMDVLGPDGVRQGGGDGRAAVEHAFRLAPVTTIWGGTSEIQRNTIAEQVLGLPRTR